MNRVDTVERGRRVRELAVLFLRLGATSFGGPAAHIAVMEEEIVRRRAWMTREHFLDLVSAANLIPGPNSTELAIHVGYMRAGWRGLLVAGACFIAPAVLIVWAVAVLYVRFGARPAVHGVLLGVQPVVLAVVAQAVWRMGRSALRTKTMIALAITCATAALLGVHELLVLLGAALAALAALGVHRVRGHSMTGVLFGTLRDAPTAPSRVAEIRPASWWRAIPVLGAIATSATPAAVFVSFVKIGSVLFGSGYVLLAFLRAEFVVRHGWLSEAQLLDAIAIGQVTPGPVFASATFIGYLLAGNAGAASATLGIFLPAFAFVALSAPVIPRLRQSRVLSAALDGVNAGSLALMAAVLSTLIRSTASAPIPSAVAAVSALLLIRFDVRATWLLVAGAVLGVLLLH